VSVERDLRRFERLAISAGKRALVAIRAAAMPASKGAAKRFRLEREAAAEAKAREAFRWAILVRRLRGHK
jgi:hypothetical protein